MISSDYEVLAKEILENNSNPEVLKEILTKVMYLESEDNKASLFTMMLSEMMLSNYKLCKDIYNRAKNFSDENKSLVFQALVKHHDTSVIDMLDLNNTELLVNIVNAAITEKKLHHLYILHCTVMVES